jgi:hypothetical protein
MSKRMYRRWAGNPQGTPEIEAQCVAQVHDEGRSPLFHQCYRKRGYGETGELCKQHAAMVERGQHVSIPEAR